jgi:predicted house-cleaning noncanonical NTP pyrophosphatase (MazG superfamily)
VTGEGKLVRDKIPQIIRAQGGEPILRIADAGEYRELLWAKLAEEVGELAAADDAHAPEELADVLEVVLALAAELGVDAGQLELLRAAKAVERGGFAKRIVWCGNVPDRRGGGRPLRPCSSGRPDACQQAACGPRDHGTAGLGACGDAIGSRACCRRCTGAGFRRSKFRM